MVLTLVGVSRGMLEESVRRIDAFRDAHPEHRILDVQYDALMRDRPSLVDDLLSGPAWDNELADAVGARAKSPSRDAAI